MFLSFLLLLFVDGPSKCFSMTISISVDGSEANDGIMRDFVVNEETTATDAISALPPCRAMAALADSFTIFWR